MKQKYFQYGLIALFCVVALIGVYRVYRYIAPPIPDVYRIAYDPTWYPLPLYGKEGSFTAFSADLIFAVARHQKIKVELVQSGPKRLLELLEDNKVHGVLSGIKQDAKAESDFIYSDPYYRFGAVLVFRKEDSFSSLLDLPNKRIAVKRYSPVLFRVQIDPKAVIVPFDSPIAAIEQLKRKEIDGVIMNRLLAYLYVAGVYESKLKVVTLPLTMEGLRLIASNDDIGEELISIFNAGLAKLKEEGAYAELLKKWDLYNPEVVSEDAL